MDLLETFRNEEAALGGTLSIAASDLAGERPLDYRPDETVRAASTIKVPLLVAWLEGVAEGRFGLGDASGGSFLLRVATRAPRLEHRGA